MQILESESPHADAFLLILDPTLKTLHVHPFKKESLSEAQEQYLIAEKKAGGDPRQQVVLVVRGLAGCSTKGVSQLLC